MDKITKIWQKYKRAWIDKFYKDNNFYVQLSTTRMQFSTRFSTQMLLSTTSMLFSIRVCQLILFTQNNVDFNIHCMIESIFSIFRPIWTQFRSKQLKIRPGSHFCHQIKTSVLIKPLRSKDQNRIAKCKIILEVIYFKVIVNNVITQIFTHNIIIFNSNF